MRERSLWVAIRRALLMIVKAIDTYLDETGEHKSERDHHHVA
jgi:hypothetical protein